MCTCSSALTAISPSAITRLDLILPNESPITGPSPIYSDRASYDREGKKDVAIMTVERALQ